MCPENGTPALVMAAFELPESSLTYVKDRPGHDRRYAIDSTKVERDLGWQPEIPFATGLQETIDWYRGNSGWIDAVRSGAYLTYYDRMYRNRQQTLSEI